MISHFKKSLKWFGYLLAFLIILLAILVQSARLAAPHIHYFHDSLEQFVSRQINSEVHFEQIEAHWPGLRPEVTVQQLRLLSGQQQEILTIERASLELDILLSLFNWAPAWRRVEVNGLVMNVSQNADGGWSVGGVSADMSSGRGWRYRSPGALFLMAKQVNIESADIHFKFHKQRQFMTHVPFINIENNGHFHRLKAQAAVDGNDSVFDFVLEGVGDPSDPAHFFAEAYLTLNRFPVERLAYLFAQVTDAKDVLPESEQGSSVDMHLWLDFTTPSRFLVNGHVELSNDKPTDFAKNNFMDIPFRSDMSGGYSIESGLTVGFRNAIVNDQPSVGLSLFNVRNGKLKGAVEHLDLQRLSDWGGQHSLLPPKIRSVFSSLSPTGFVDNLHFSVDFLALANTHITANARNVTVGAWENVPAFKNVSGYIETDLKQGFVLVDAENFELHPKKIYSQSLVFKTAKGYVGWDVMLDDGRVNIMGQHLSVDSIYGKAGGNFSLDIPIKKRTDKKSAEDKTHRDTQLILQLGLQDSKAKYQRQLIPNVLPKSFIQWLNASVKKGDIDQAGLFYRGGLKKDSERVVQLFVDVEEGQLDFSSDWPALNQLNGRVMVNNTSANGVIEQGTIYGREKFKGQFSWNASGRERLKVRASGLAASQDGLRFIRESWLRTTVNDVIDQVSMKGQFSLDIDLDIPLNDGKSYGTQNVAVNLYKNTLSFDKLNLTFNQLDGKLLYSTKKGFTSEKLKAELFNKPLTLTMGEGPWDSASTLMIKGEGVADVAPVVQWLQEPMLSPLSGEFTYTANLQLPMQDGLDIKPALFLETNLVGVDSKIPRPFSKPASAHMPVSVSMMFNTNDTTDYDIKIGTYYNAIYRLLADGSHLSSTSISDTNVGPVSPLSQRGIKLHAQFDQFEAEAWYDFYNEYADDGAGAEQTADLFLSTNVFQIGESRFSNVLVSGQREQQGWSFIVDGDDVLGGIYMDDDARPMVVDVDYLNWPASEENTEEPKELEKDLFADLNPATLSAANVTINRLVYDDKPLGSWYFELRPDNDGLEIRNIYATATGLSLVGTKAEQGAFLRWQSESLTAPSSTRFMGAIKGSSPKQFMDQWQLPSMIDSESVYIESDLSWVGSPLAFSVESLRGTMAANYQNGVFLQQQSRGATGLLKVFGVLNFDSWARRLRLGFSDVYKKGIYFNTLSGALVFDDGIIHIDQPIVSQGPSSKMSFMGQLDYIDETIDGDLKVTLPVGGNLTVVAGIAGGLPAAAGVFIMSKLFGKQVDKVSTINYALNGNWSDPVVQTKGGQNGNRSQSIEDDYDFDEFGGRQ